MGSKVGISKGMNILGFWTKPDYSIQAAAQNGGIKKISTVDLKETRYLINVCVINETIVTGE